MDSEKSSTGYVGIKNLGCIWDGNPTNVLEQMDVEEFFNMLMDRIETAIKGSPNQDTIK